MSYEGPERRSIDRSTLTLEQNALRTAEHRFNWQLPGNYDEIPNAEFEGGAEMKAATRGVLERVKVIVPTEIMKVVDLVERQLSGAVDLVQTRLIKPDMELVKKPSLKLVMELMNLTLEQAARINQMQNAAMEFALDLPFANYVEAINRNKMRGQEDTYIDPDLGWGKRPLQREGQVAWTPCIGESAQEIEENSWAGQRLDNQVAQWDQGRPDWLLSQDRESYSIRQIRATGEGNPLDKRNWSVLRDPTQKEWIAGGVWYRARVRFYGHHPLGPARDSRFREEVVGDKCT